MNREYHKAYSHELNRDMELLVFGHAGQPMLVFPSSMGKFFEYEDTGMIRVLAGKIESGGLQVFCVDSVDSESLYNKGVHPGSRIWRHVQYERYLLNEFLPFLKWKNWASQIAVTGCSFGGYHALNFALRHPDLVSSCVSMSGSFDIRSFLDGYYDDNVYFNNPVDYLANMSGRMVPQPLPAHEHRAGNGGLGHVPGCKREDVRADACEGYSALAGHLGRQ